MSPCAAAAGTENNSGADETHPGFQKYLFGNSLDRISVPVSINVYLPVRQCCPRCIFGPQSKTKYLIECNWSDKMSGGILVVGWPPISEGMQSLEIPVQSQRKERLSPLMPVLTQQCRPISMFPHLLVRSCNVASFEHRPAASFGKALEEEQLCADISIWWDT